MRPGARNRKWSKIERLQAQVRLLPLLFKDVELKHIGLAGVDVLLETDSNGQGNWDFTGGDKSAEKASGRSNLSKIDIDQYPHRKPASCISQGQDSDRKSRFKLASLDVARQGV